MTDMPAHIDTRPTPIPGRRLSLTTQNIIYSSHIGSYSVQCAFSSYNFLTFEHRIPLVRPNSEPKQQVALAPGLRLDATTSFVFHVHSGPTSRPIRR